MGKAVFDPRHTEEKVPPSVSRFTAAELKEKRILSQIHEHLLGVTTTKKGETVAMSKRTVKACMEKFGDLWQQLTVAKEEREAEAKQHREDGYRSTMGHRTAQDGLKEEKRVLEARILTLEEENAVLVENLQKEIHKTKRPVTFEGEERRWKQSKLSADAQGGKTKEATKRFHSLTGIGDPEALRLLYKVVSRIVKRKDGKPLGSSKSKTGKGRQMDLTPHDQLFLFLFLLKTGSKFKVAGALWGTSSDNVSVIFRRWLSHMYRAANLLTPVPSRETIRQVRERGKVRLRLRVRNGNEREGHIKGLFSHMVFCAVLMPSSPPGVPSLLA